MRVHAQYITGLESFLALSSVGLALAAPNFARSFAQRFLRPVRRLAARPRLAMLAVALLPCLARFALLPWMPVPQPAIQEEFSYLLQADTFAHGRLANPTSPMAVFFDNVQIVQSPHYESVRPPGQGAFLAIGQVLFHLPWLGVCLSVALMCAAVYWMLLAWTRPQWALLTAFLFGLRFGIFTFWMNSYWGGAVNVLGGALVLGAAPRIVRATRTRDAIWFIFGCGLLAATRPFEGAIFVLPVAVALLAWWLRSRSWTIFRTRTLRAVCPALLLGLAVLGWFAYFNMATTGSPVTFAYQLWRHQQSVVPEFLWQHLRSPLPDYRSPQVREFNAVWEVASYHDMHVRPLTTAWLVLLRPLRFLSFHLRPLLLLPLVFWPDPKKQTFFRGNIVAWLAFLFGIVALVFTGTRHQHHSQFVVLSFFILIAIRWAALVRRRLLLLPSAILFCGLLSMLPTTFWMLNYDPAFAAVLFIFIAEGMRRIHAWRRLTGEGAAIVRNLVLSCIAIALILASFPMLHIPVVGEDPFHWSSYENRLADRAQVAAWLTAQPGKQLAIVRYGPNHDLLHEWIYNGADLENEKVVWAQELRPDWDAALLRHYKDRHAWLIQPDDGATRILPYPAANLPAPVDPRKLPVPGNKLSIPGKP